jgi:hypothetical protein
LAQSRSKTPGKGSTLIDGIDDHAVLGALKLGKDQKHMANKSYKLYQLKNKLQNPGGKTIQVYEDSESMSSFELDGPAIKKDETLDLDLNDRTFGATGGNKLGKLLKGLK